MKTTILAAILLIAVSCTNTAPTEEPIKCDTATCDSLIPTPMDSTSTLDTTIVNADTAVVDSAK